MEGQIVFENQLFSFREFASINLPKNLKWAEKTQLFINEWLDGTESFLLQTSGSTGSPKSLEISRTQMTASAMATLQYLNIPEGCSALLCMNPDMIGGRMMLVRAILGKWKLHVLPPSSEPICSEPIYFTAMVPLQVETLLNSSEGKAFLNGIKTIIIGGAQINDTLKTRLSDINTAVYQTFGMTETVSHIALRRINGNEASEFYTLIGDNLIQVNEEGLLSVKGTVTNHQWIHTHDKVEATENGFKWLGRADLVVNTGGIKVQIEDLEKELSDYFKSNIWIWKLPHERLGEQLVGLTDDEHLVTRASHEYELIKRNFQPYHFPKKWILVKKWHLTASGKPDRKTTLWENH